MNPHRHSKLEIAQWLRGMHDYAREIDQSYLIQAAELLCPTETARGVAPSSSEPKMMLIAPDTLRVTHICDGEEVVTGDDDGQTWVATFASIIAAANYLELIVKQGKAIYGHRHSPRAETPDSSDALIDALHDTVIASYPGYPEALQAVRIALRRLPAASPGVDT